MGGERGLSEGTRAAFEALMRPPHELFAAEAAITAARMRSAGLDYPVAAALAGLRPPQPPRLAGLGTPLDPAAANEIGYGALLTPLPGSDPVENAEGDYLSTLGPAGRRAYHRALVNGSHKVTVNLSGGLVVGAPTAGCIAEARQALYGSVETFLRIVSFRNELPRGLVDAAMNDTGVRRVLRDYERRMGGHGHRFRTPMLAVRAARERFGQTRPAAGPITDEERMLAVADATAQQGSGCNSTIDDAVVAAAMPWILANEERLLGLAQQQAVALSAASAWLGP